MVSGAKPASQAVSSYAAAARQQNELAIVLNYPVNFEDYTIL